MPSRLIRDTLGRLVRIWTTPKLGFGVEGMRVRVDGEGRMRAKIGDLDAILPEPPEGDESEPEHRKP